MTQPFEDHPSPDQLLAYHAGNLEDSDSLQEHLAACQDCLQLTLDLDRFPDLDRSAGRDLSDADVATAWRNFEVRVRRHASPASSGRWRWLTLVAPIPAAAMALIVVGLGLGLAHFWTRSLEMERQLEELARPQANVPVVNLFGDAFRSDGEPLQVVLPAGTESFVILLNPGRQGTGAEHDVVIREAAGQVLWTQERLRPDSFGAFPLVLTRRFLPPGEYHIVLSSAAHGIREPLGDYRIEIVDED